MIQTYTLLILPRSALSRIQSEVHPFDLFRDPQWYQALSLSLLAPIGTQNIIVPIIIFPIKFSLFYQDDLQNELSAPISLCQSLLLWESKVGCKSVPRNNFGFGIQNWITYKLDVGECHIANGEWYEDNPCPAVIPHFE